MSENYLISINPATEKELGRIIAGDRRTIDETVERARHAQKMWASLTIRERQAQFIKLMDLILEEQQEIAELIAGEQGKPVTEAMASEVIAVLGILKDISRHAHRVLRPHKMVHEQILFAHKKSDYRLEPYGIIAVISPWNYPFSVPVPEIAAALVAGNSVVFKPAPDAVLIGRKTQELFDRAGFPENVVQTLFIYDADAPHLTHHPGIDKIIFTGSTPVGRDVMCEASHQMTSVVLELGGKDPAIVAADADVSRAARGIVWGALFNAGQVCASVERVYVEKTIAEKFIDLCLQHIKKVVPGDPLDPATQIGPLSTLDQLIKVQDQIKDAIRRGATLLYGGNRLDRSGYFMEPTLLANVDHSMPIMTEETFGPVLPIMVADSLDQAIELANDSIYGLSAYGWTRSRKTAQRLVRELQAGTVMINDSTSSWGEPNAPWGGYKMSGIGRTRARFGLEEMVQVKYASFDSGKTTGNLWWYPYNQQSSKFMYNAAKLLYSRNLFTKLGSCVRILGTQSLLSRIPLFSFIRNLHKLF